MNKQVEKIKKELERRIREDYNGDEHEDEVAQGVCASMLYYINSLEEEPVSEDLEKESLKWLEEHQGRVFSCIDFAKHFYELGLSVTQPHINIPDIDDILEEGGIEPNSKVAKMFKESYYKALDNTLHKGE